MVNGADLGPLSRGAVMLGRTRFISLILSCLFIGGALVWQATRSTAAIVLTPSSLAGSGDRHKLRIRMGGRVAAEGLLYSTNPSFVLSFRLEDREEPGKSVPVIYQDIKPDMFAPGRDVLVDGDWKGGIFHASHLLTQCPSKYEPKLPSSGDALPGSDAATSSPS